MKTLLTIIIFMALSLTNKSQTVTDIDGNTYNTITIGTQVWMKENLKTTKYRDGTMIPENNAAWLTTPAFTWYNDSVSYKNLYGALYNWYVVQTGKLCPSGWHVPTDEEWTILATYLGGDSIAGGKLKESGTDHWKSPNEGADNSTGFTALPCAFRYPGGSYSSNGIMTFMWSSSQSQAYNDAACSRNLEYNTSNFVRSDHPVKNNGFSVRCLKDVNAAIKKFSDNSVDKIIYPNPANDKLYLKTNKFSKAHLTIFDLQNKRVLDKQWNSLPIDISKLPTGVYLVRISDKENVIINKLIKK